MKKIYNFLALLLFCMAGTMSAYAQSESEEEVTWVLSENQIEAPANGMLVALQQGNYGAWSSNGYLNPSGSYKAEFDETCVYEIVEVGTSSVDGAQLYVLRNVGNKQYIYSGGHTLSYNDAFQCSIMKGYLESDNVRNKLHSEERQPGSDGATWMFCDYQSADNYTFLCYWACPAYSSYSDTADWKVYEASKHEATPTEKLEKRYNALFSGGFDETVYPVGTNPGCITQEAYDKLAAAYAAAAGVQDGKEHTDAEILAAVALLDEAQAAYDKAFITPTAGKYYYFINQRGQDAMYDNNGSLYCTSGKSSLSSPLTVSEAKYIWYTESAGTEGYYTLKNFATNRYIQTQGSTSYTFPLGTSNAIGITFKQFEGQKFLMTDANGNMLHNAGGMNVVRWQSTGTGNQYLIYEVSAEEVAALSEAVKKSQLITSLTDLVADAQHLSAKYQNTNGCTLDGVYDSEAAGLVKEMTKANATETSEGKESYLFDGKVNTFYHTKWNGATADNDYDWIQLDLGKELQNVTVKMSQRHNNGNGNPSKIAWVAAADGDDPDDVWTDTLSIDTVIYEYTTPGITRTEKVWQIDENGDSVQVTRTALTTAIMNVDFGKAVQNVRMAVLKTKANQIHGDLGPCWHLSELRIYEDLGHNARYDMIPEATRNALAEAIANAQATLKDSTCTQADYDNLEAAMKAFEAAYPDDTELNEYIEEAKAQAAAENMEGDAWGYFETGAQAELSTAIAAIESEIAATTPLSLEGIAKQKEAVRAAMATFNGKLHTPEDGDIVRIISASVSDGEANAPYGNYVCATSADTVGNIDWDYKDDANADSRLNSYWQVNKQSDGTVALRNVATGRYLGNIYTGVEDRDEVALSQTTKSVAAPQYVTFTSAKQGGIFNITLTEGRYLNTDPNGGIANWSNGEGNSLFTIEEAETGIVGEEYAYSVKKNNIQVVTLPLATAGSPNQRYKVLGQKDGKLQLAAYGDDELIPAGTPFVIQTGEEEDFIKVYPNASTVEELVEEGYEYGHIAQNGLVGTLNALKVKAGLGLLIDNVVKNSVDNTSVSAGSGYFTEIPETTEDGDLTVEITEVINGIASIDAATDAPADVYSITGVKVRNGKSAKNLPAGLYIIGGQKVLVK